MKQIIAQVHDHGAKIYGATFTPYEGAVVSHRPASRDTQREYVRIVKCFSRSLTAQECFSALAQRPNQRVRPTATGEDRREFIATSR